jgi:hypothetical protein|tara:strand:+ start:142 stop:390 length:249 start_codon:yes stop_codon:yes gene_type:complete
MSKKAKHSKILGTDYDPDNDMSLDIKPDGDCDVKYKGQKMDYMTYVDEMEDRATRHSQGKPMKSNGLFAGFGKGTLKKSYEK